MCGLAGIYYDDGTLLPDAEMLRKMVQSLGHRGPDGKGYLAEPGIGLGHSRLSIIDPAGGAQPMCNDERSVCVVYNGEVFNYPELRQELIQLGYRFRTATDTEVLINLYSELGDGFVERLNGQFAFALWDRSRRRLLLARDRAGILPLYWCRIAGQSDRSSGVLFASEIKALFASNLVTAAADPDGLDEVWTFWSTSGSRSVFRGVEQLRAGELLTLESGRSVARQYWRWDFPAIGEHRRDPVHAVQAELIDLLGDATRLRLRADVPVGAYLSGGLDSSSVVALLNRSIAESLHTFSIGFDDPGLDESEHQKIVSDQLQTHHHHLSCTNAEIAASFPAAIRHAETPVLRSAPAPMRLLSQSVHAAGLKVVLTGEGADEVLGGYDIFKEAKVRRFWAANPASRWRPLLLKRLYPYLDLAGGQSDAYLREFFGQELARTDDPFFSHRPRWANTAQCKMFWSTEFAHRVSSSAEERLRNSLPDEFRNWHPFNRAEYLEAKIFLPGYLLSSQGDRMLMANSVEGRFPYLDHRLIRFANSLHPTLKMRALTEKYVLRAAMRSVLPPSIVERPKQPYRAPDASAFLDGQVPDYVNELTNPSVLKRYGYFDPSKVSRLIAKLKRSPIRTQRENMAFMGILSTQLWHNEFLEQ